MPLQTVNESLLKSLRDETAVQDTIFPFLASYHLVPQVLSELVVDRAIAHIQCTAEETEQACETYYQSRKLITPEERKEWRSRYSLTDDHVAQLATRHLRVEKFKHEMWQNKLGSYFLKRKRHLDRVIYSILRTRDRGLALELFFRIDEGEQTLSELARSYSEGPEAQTSGLVGPVEFGTLPQNLADILYSMPEGQVSPPVPFGEWFAIVRVEKRLPAQLNEAMERRLLQENFEGWFKEQVQTLTPQDQAWIVG